MLFYQFTKEISKIHPNYFKWIGTMFFYGFARGLNSEYDKSRESFVTRLLLSTGNGVIYTTPYGIIKLKHLVDRYNKKQDPMIYYECFGINKNILL